MSDSSSGDRAEREERAPDGAPSGASGPDADAWATAAEEDLRAERARRRERYGPQPGDAAEELRRLADTIAERLTGLGLGLATGPFAAQARAALEPIVERNAETLRHLANAGQELLAAYRSAVLSHEQRWTRGGPGHAERGAGRAEAAAEPDGAQDRDRDPEQERAEDGGRGDGQGDGQGGAPRAEADAGPGNGPGTGSEKGPSAKPRTEPKQPGEAAGRPDAGERGEQDGSGGPGAAQRIDLD